jgi:ATP-dependent Clp protease ATP-binding subunit ClpB
LKAVSDCVRLAQMQLQALDRTLGNFLFLGPTSVGKTELCKAIVECLFDDKNAMTRVDMSEYGEKHTVSRLISAPPGYVGYEEGGTLTESVRHRPYQILFLDEFEKGHRNVWNILLQLFDDGHLTDSRGRKVDFRNVIVVMRSNIGANVFAQLPPDLSGSKPAVQEVVIEVVRGMISPELLNCIDESVVFNQLQHINMDSIARIQLDEISKCLMDGQNMTLDVSDIALSCISDKGYNVRYGARPLKQVLNSTVLNPLSQLVLEDSVLEGDTVKVRTRGEVESLTRNVADVTSDLRSWISSNNKDANAGDQNDIILLQNHTTASDKESESKTWDDEEFLLKNGTHAHC